MKILIANGAHIGDLILTTSVLQPLKKAFPNGKIGMLVGSWAKEVVDNHLFVDNIHIYDQACIDRSYKRKKEKKARESLTWHQAMREIQKESYDVALDIYTFYKKSAGHFLYQAQIPQRVAYWGCYTPFFYNRLLFWNWKNKHMVENYKIFLNEWGLPSSLTNMMEPCLEYRSTPSFEFPFSQKEYLVIHMGVGDSRRKWPTGSWKELVALLSALDLPLVFVGKGKEEQKEIEEVVPYAKKGVNLCNQISWKELLLLIQNSRLLIGLESMAGHLAAATKTHGVLIYGGSVPVFRWSPFSEKCTIVTPANRYFHPIKKKTSPSTIQTIQPRDIFESAYKMLRID